jgi:adenylate cyclase
VQSTVNGLRWLIVVLVATGWGFAAALAVDYTARNSFLLWLEHWSGDWRTAHFADRKSSQHPDVAVITVTEETLNAFPYRSPVDRAYVARLAAALDRVGARAIGLDFLMIRPTEPEKDAQLTQTLKQLKTPIVIAAGDTRAGLTPDELAYQARFIRETGATPGFANLLTGGDRIVRFLATPVPDGQVPLSFAQALAAPTSKPLREPRRIAWLLKPRDNSDTFLTLPAHLLAPPALSGPSPTEAVFGRLLKGKIVIIGADLADVDRHFTPLPDWEGEVQPGAFLQAQVVAQILDGRDILRLRHDLLMALYAFLAFLGLYFGIRHGALAYSLYGSGALLSVAALDIVLFVTTRQFIPFGACVLALTLGLIGGLLIRRLLRFV